MNAKDVRSAGKVAQMVEDNEEDEDDEVDEDSEEDDVGTE